MKKLLNILLIVTSLIGYLEWGNNQHMFLFQVESDILFGRPANSDTFLHPFVLMPLLGQLILLFTLFQKTPSKALTYIGLFSLGFLLLLLFFIGITGPNFRILLFSVPFIVTGVLVILANKRKKPSRPAPELNS